MGNSSTGRYAQDLELWDSPNKRRFADHVEADAAAAAGARGVLRRLAAILASRAFGAHGRGDSDAGIGYADAALARASGTDPGRVADLEAAVLRRVGLRRDELSAGEADRLRAAVLAEAPARHDKDVVRRAIQDLARG